MTTRAKGGERLGSREWANEAIRQLFNGEDVVSRGFLEVIQTDLLGALRETLRPCARV